MYTCSCNEDAYDVSSLQAVKTLYEMSKQCFVTSENRPVPQTEVVAEQEAKGNDLLSFCFKNGASTDENEMGTQPSEYEELKREFQIYSAIAKPTSSKCPLDFWRVNQDSFPFLSRVARLVFTPSASSTSSERVFSVGGAMRSKRRARLTSGTIECLVKVGYYLKKYGTIPELVLGIDNRTIINTG